MKRIETLEDMLVWSKRANENRIEDLNERLELQDIFGRSIATTLKELYLKADGQRSLISFGIYKTMGYDQFMEFVRHFARHYAEEIIAKEEKALSEKQRIFDESKRAMFRRIKALREKNLELQLKIAKSKDLDLWRRDRVVKLLAENKALSGVAAKYKQLKEALE